MGRGAECWSLPGTLRKENRRLSWPCSAVPSFGPLGVSGSGLLPGTCRAVRSGWSGLRGDEPQAGEQSPSRGGAGCLVFCTELSVPTAPTCGRVPTPHWAPSAAPQPCTHPAPQPQRGLSSLLSPQAPLRSFESPVRHQHLPLAPGQMDCPLQQP